MLRLSAPVEIAGECQWIGVAAVVQDESRVTASLDYVRRLGADVKLEQAAAEPTELLEQGFSAVFIGIGLGRPYTIGLEGEDLPHVHVASDLLTAIAMGERPSLGSRVVVIGGGNVAMDAAMAALRLGAGRVDVCCLESYDEMPAFRSEIEEVQSEGIVFHTRTRPVRIVAEGNKVVGYEGVGISWKEPGLLIPSNAVDVPGTEFGLAADSIIEAIGTGVLDRFEGVETDERGVVRTDPETMATSLSGVFAGGDVVSGGATAVRAYAEGKRAAEGIIAFLDSRDTEGGGR